MVSEYYFEWLAEKTWKPQSHLKQADENINVHRRTLWPNISVNGLIPFKSSSYAGETSGVWQIRESLRRLSFVNRSKFTKGQRMQIPCGICYEMPQENLVWTNPAGTWSRFPGTGTAERMRNYWGASDARSCAYADLDCAEVFGWAGDGVSEGKNSDPHCARVMRGGDGVS